MSDRRINAVVDRLRRGKAERSGLRTGRTQLVREYLAKQTEARSAREILNAVEPGGDINLMSACLGTMSRNGVAIREGQGPGVRWRIGKVPGGRSKPRSPKGSVPLPAVAKEPAKTAVAKAPPKPPTPAQQPSVVARPVAAKATKQRTNFTAPLSTVAMPEDDGKSQVTRDIEAFVRNKGRIEVLPFGAVSQPLKYHHGHQFTINPAAAARRTKS